MDIPQQLLKPSVRLTPLSSGLWTSLPPEMRGADYDRIASGYDLLVGNPVYNRIVWGVWPRRYADAAAEALALASNGPALDCGCGSLVFTAPAYRQASPDCLILFDNSTGMMARGQRRLPLGTFVQGSALDMPFADSVFPTVMAWGLLHVFGSGSGLLSELRRVTGEGGTITISTLVLGERRIANRMLGLLHRKGEAAEPETEEQVTAAFSRHFLLECRERHGAMLFLQGKVR